MVYSTDKVIRNKVKGGDGCLSFYFKGRQKELPFFYYSMKVILLALVMCAIAVSGEAALQLSVTPYEGGTSLRFGKVGSSSLLNKEVKLRITSTDNKQYQVFQRLISPLVNERGVELNMQALNTYTLRGSNASGTLYQEEAAALGYSDQLLYTSNNSGLSDSFFVIYLLKGEHLNARGKFLGKIIYTLRSIEGSSQETYVLDVFLDASGELKIEKETSWGGNAIRLGTRNEQEEKGYVKLSFAGNLGKKLQIYQELEQFPRNELNEPLNEESVKFFVTGGSRGEVYYKSPAGLGRKRLLVYSSDSEQDSLFINFLINEEAASRQKAGSYRGKLNYIIEDSGSPKILSLDLEIEISPLFKLETIIPPEGLHFADLLPNSPPQFREVKVIVKTNLGKPYIVMQKVRSPLANERGEEIPLKFFTIKEEIAKGYSGKIEFADFRPISLGEKPVFFSDAKGSPAEFKIIYRLKSYAGILYGNYATVISYSLEER